MPSAHMLRVKQCIKCNKPMKNLESSYKQDEFYCPDCQISLPVDPQNSRRMDIINDLEKQGFGDKLREFYKDMQPA